MKWNDVVVGDRFKDDSVIVQRHPTHNYPCYTLHYELDGNPHTITCSADHIFKINIKNLPEEAKDYVRKYCNGNIPLKEDIHLKSIGDLPKDMEKVLVSYLKGNHSNIGVEIEDYSTEHFEGYSITMKDGRHREVMVERVPTEYESQKIDDNTYWIPMSGLYWLLLTYGVLDVTYSPKTHEV